MKIETLLQSAGYAVPLGIKNAEVTGVTDDSRRVHGGEVFVAVSGLHRDGAAYAAAAVAKGAVLVVCEHPIDSLPCLAVSNARAAFAKLSAAFWEHPEKAMTLIGITGTNGKTTTAAMLAHILRAAGRRVGLVGTVGHSIDGEPLSIKSGNALANMTTPDPGELYRLLAMMRDRGADTVVMEVTSHALALSKVEPLFFACAVFTNLTQDHLDFHGDMERYFREKCKLFDRCEKAVVSLSSAYGERLAAMHPGTLTLGEHNLKNVCSTADGVRFTLLQAAAPLTVEIPIPGTFIVERHLKKGSVFISADDNSVFLVHGIISSWEEMLQGTTLPVILHATLLPFKNVIISDGLVSVNPVHFGRSIASNFKDVYMDAKRRGALITNI